MSLSVDQALLRARSHTKRGEIDLAAQQYQSVLEKFPNNKRAIKGLAALQKLNAVRATPISSPSQAQISGLFELYNQGRFQEALVKGEALATQFPNVSFVPNLLGAVNVSLGRLEQAAACYDMALQIQPDYAEAHSNLGSVLKQLGKLDEAIASYDQALQIEPDYAEAYYNLGNALKDLGEFEKAVAKFSKALQIKPDYAEAHFNLGAVLKDLGKPEEAVASYENALQLRPDYAEAYSNLGAALRELKKTEEAIVSLKKALQLKPDLAEAYSNLGSALQDLGKLDEAIESFHKALTIKPDLANAHYNLGDAFTVLGKLDEAIRSFDMAGTRMAMARSLECSYALEEYDVFHTKLGELIDRDGLNIRAAAISAFAAHQLDRDDPYPFCKNPLDFIRIRHLDDCAGNTEGLIDGLLHDLSHRSAVWEPTNVTTKFGFQTPPDLFFSPENSLARLDRFIKQEIGAYHSEYGSARCIFTDIWPEELRLIGWSVRMLDQGHQASHIHSSGWLSGVLYLKIPSELQGDEGAIEFSLHGFDYPILKDDYPRLLHHPKTGEFILFPSSVFHRTVPISGDCERVSIAFDLLPLSWSAPLERSSLNVSA